MFGQKPKIIYKCEKCDKQIKYGAKYCANCGAKLSWGNKESKNHYCSNCGEKIGKGEDYCSNCGESINTKSKKNSRLATNGNSSKKNNILPNVLAVIGGIIVAIIAYFFWVNSHAFEGSFFGMTFRMPLENVEHYCSRKAHGILTYDAYAYQKCLNEEASNSKRHSSLKNYMLNTFKDDTTNMTAITDSQAECMANKIEAKLTDEQIDEFIKGKSIGDQLGASKAFEVMSDIMKCVEQTK